MSANSPAEIPAFQDVGVLAIADELREALEPAIHLLRPLGAGAMGLVFLGRDPLLKRLVAIKVLSPVVADTEMRARFVREAEASAAVAHPNVAGIYLVGELPKSRLPYFVMQFIEGRTLAEEIANGAVSESRAKRLIGEIASALAAAHSRGLVHRDVKPSNIMLESESDRPVVLDFGISAVLEPGGSLDAKLTRAGTYLGTPTYMSPEQTAGEPVTGKSDVYSLGAVAFELLAGRPPFEGPAFVVMAAHVQQAPENLHTVRSGVDPHLATLVDRCLRKNPDERPSAADVAQSLLPDRHALIEWPPPGLAMLRGHGVTLVWLWSAICVAAFLFFVLLYERPTLSSPKWTEGETSSVWSGLISAGDAVTAGGKDRRGALVTSSMNDATPVWTLLVGLDVAIMLALILVSAVQTARFARDMRRASRAGYPVRVLFDVAWDRYDDTPAVLNSAGSYALLDVDQRGRVVRGRRHQALVAVAIVVVTVLVPIEWLLDPLGAQSSSTDIVTGWELIAFATPAFVGLILLAILSRRMRAIAGAPPAGSGRRRLFRRELVDSWLRSSGEEKTRVRLSGLLAVLGPSAAAGVLIVLGYLMMVVFSVVFVSTIAVSNGRRAADGWRRSFGITSRRAFDRDSTRPMTFAELDTLSRRLGVAQRPGNPDVEAGHLLFSRPFLTESLPPSAASLALDMEGARSIQRRGPEPVANMPATLYSVLGDTNPPPRAAVEAIAAYAQSPWLDVWRRVAYSSDFPTLWQFRPNLPATNSLWDMPMPRNASTKDLAYRNSLAGYVSLAHGDIASAIARGRENVAVGRQFMHGATLLDHLYGLVITGIGASELGIVGKATKNQALIDEARQHRAARIRLRREELPGLGWLSMVADPGSREVIGLTKEINAPAYFASLLVNATSGYCLNPREILFGIDPARIALVHDIGRAWGMPRAPELERLATNWLSDVDSGRGTLPVQTSRRDLAPLTWLGLGRLRNRIEMCASVQML